MIAMGVGVEYGFRFHSGWDHVLFGRGEVYKDLAVKKNAGESPEFAPFVPAVPVCSPGTEEPHP